MTTDTQTLAAWLLEQIADDEAVARAASQGPWDTYEEPDKGFVDEFDKGVCRLDPTISVILYEGQVRGDDADHIARHDPARVLAQCEAHRKIVELHEGWHPLGTLIGGSLVCSTCAENYEVDHDGAPMIEWPCPTVRAIAAIYADREGFRDEWVL